MEGVKEERSVVIERLVLQHSRGMRGLIGSGNSKKCDMAEGRGPGKRTLRGGDHRSTQAQRE